MIFEPFRTLGLVCSASTRRKSNAALIDRPKLRQTLLVIPRANYVHTFTTNGLGFTSISDELSSKVDFIKAEGNLIAAVSLREISILIRLRKVKHTIKFKEDIVDILMIGKVLIVALSKHLEIYDAESGAFLKKLELSSAQKPNSKICSIVHPHTYVNKILVASTDGKILLVNFDSGEELYTYSFKEPVEFVEQTTELDIVSIKFAGQNSLCFHNLKTDETLFQLHFGQSSSQVANFAFIQNGQPLLVAAHSNSVGIYNLEERKLFGFVENAHEQPIGNILSLPFSNNFLTTGNDNCIKVWTFDDDVDPKNNTLPRLLHQRSGLNGMPVDIQFFGGDSNYLLASGSDSRLHVLSTRHESLDRNFGTPYSKAQVKGNETTIGKISRITSNSIRKDDFDSIFCIHKNMPKVSSWNFERQTFSKMNFLPRGTSANLIPSSIKVSACGHYVYVGYTSGELAAFSTQRSTFKGLFGGKKAHAQYVSGIDCDKYSKTVFSSSFDSCVSIWDSEKLSLLGNIKFRARVESIVYSNESKLLAALLDNMKIGIIDAQAKCVARFFTFDSQLNSLCFSHDSRWLIVASSDSNIYINDLATGKTIEIMKCNTPPASICMSDNGEFLATSNLDRCEIQLYSNTALFSFVSLASGEKDSSQLPDSLSNTCNKLVKYSQAHESHWKNILYLDEIRERNALKINTRTASRALPFFIEADNFGHLDDNDTVEGNDVGAKVDEEEYENSFIKLINWSYTDNNYAIVDWLSSKGPMYVDDLFRVFELSKEANIGAYKKNLLRFIAVLSRMADAQLNFDLGIVYSYLLLKHCSDYLQNPSDEVFEAFSELISKYKTKSCKVFDRASECMSIMKFLKSDRVL